MNRLSTMNAAAQISSVTCSAVSIEPQFDASGVCHHGLKTWNSTDPSTSNAIATATYMGSAS
jgi:hypothetical protein